MAGRNQAGEAAKERNAELKNALVTANAKIDCLRKASLPHQYNQINNNYPRGSES